MSICCCIWHQYKDGAARAGRTHDVPPPRLHRRRTRLQAATHRHTQQTGHHTRPAQLHPTNIRRNLGAGRNHESGLSHRPHLLMHLRASCSHPAATHLNDRQTRRHCAEGGRFAGRAMPSYRLVGRLRARTAGQLRSHQLHTQEHSGHLEQDQRTAPE